jgi:two-component system, cell cycle sensor histidine kinase and response regulator CckA
MGEPGIVLLIDDEPLMRRTCVRIMERYDIPVHAEEDGRSGIEWFAAHTSEVSLILVDLGLPDMDGGAALARIRELRPDVPAIISSGAYPSDPSIDDPDGPPTRFLMKPFRANDLLAVIRELT